MTYAEAFDTVLSMCLLCGVFAPLAMCAGFGRTDRKTGSVKRGAVAKRRTPAKKKVLAKVTKPGNAKARTAPPLSEFEQRIFDVYHFNRQFKAA